MKRVALEKVAKIDRTVASEEDCQIMPYVGLEHVEKDAGHFSTSFVPNPESVLATKFRFTSKHVLYGKLRPYLNKVVMPNFAGVCTTEILPILPCEDELDRTFLWGYLLTPEFVSWASMIVSGANLPRLAPSDLAKHEIPLPPIEEQRRIAGILARADRLWQLRRYALQLSEGYLQSVFLQMFGDPVTNPMGWEIRPLGKLLTTIDSGVSPVCQERPALDNEWGILKLGAVTTCNYLETENKAITSKTSPRMELEVKSGDLLFSRKNTYDLVGACAYVHHTRLKLMLPDLIFRLQIEDKKELDPIYLWQLLIFPTKRKMVQRLAGGSAGSMPNISKGRLNTVEIPLPSPELQSKFACVVRQAERLRAQQHEAARQAEHLFATLLHRAFTPSP